MRCRLALFAVLWFFLVTPLLGNAATIYLDPVEGEYRQGDTFIVNVRIDPNGECVNVVSAVIAYPKEQLRASAFSQGESILTLWTETPRIDASEGLVSFSGGVPGGYCGRIAGDPGYANVLGKIIFTVPPTAPLGTLLTIHVLPTSQALLADGRGTPAKLLVGQATMRIASGTGAVVNEWLAEIDEDAIPPESFSIELYKNENTVGGKYFAVFQTTDKQSGVARYEIIERDHERPQYIRGTRSPAVWRPAVSPYVLEDQTLLSDIVVRAFDHKGNIREEAIAPRNADQAKEGVGGSLLYGGAVFILLLVLSVILRSKRRHPA